MRLALQQRATRFLHWLPDNQSGYIEVVAGEADPERPDKIKLLMKPESVRIVSKRASSSISTPSGPGATPDRRRVHRNR